MEINDSHLSYMQIALAEAEKAGQIDEIPVGAVLVAKSGEVLTSAHNQVIRLNDPTAHAEIITIRKAGRKLLNYRLLDTTLYVTVEPCLMCMGAIIHARISRVFFAAADPKWGAAGSLYHFAQDARLNHQPEVVGGVCESAGKTLMQTFFRNKRNSPAAK